MPRTIKKQVAVKTENLDGYIEKLLSKRYTYGRDAGSG